MNPEKISPSVAIIIAGVLVAGAVIWASRNPVPTVAQPAQQAAQPSVDIANVKVAGEPFFGEVNAPVTMAYWFDYQCPFCQRFEQQTMPQVIENYVKTGKVKIVFKDYQFLGDDSVSAGLASHAVWEVAPSKFYDWHKAMFEKQDAENSGWGSKADVLALTKTVLGGADASKVAQLMESKKAEYQKAMDDDKLEGTNMGISGTPGSIVGKQLISGAQPYSAVQQAIETALK